MITVRRAAERGHTRTRWLDSAHTFSFNRYYDPRHMGFRALRVINEDRVSPGGGFGTHSHDNMEIVTYVLAGTLAHADSTGVSSTIRPGEVQRMSAGTGISHSESNGSDTEPVHFLQIWIEPALQGLAPGYEQRRFWRSDEDGVKLVAAQDGRQDAVTIHQDLDLYIARLGRNGRLAKRLRPQRHVWVHVATGAARLLGQNLAAGDGAALSEEAELELSTAEPAEVLVFDLV
jgi:redox-sensitive bicupin YhaK (pirin superfamily)